MNQQDKTKIKQMLEVYIKRYPSQNAAAQSLRNVSQATIHHMISGKWANISDRMWRNVGAQVGFGKTEWKPVETKAHKLLNFYLHQAQMNSHVFAITAEAGSGKTFACKHYCAENQEAYLIACNEYWNRKMFLSHILRVMGKDSSGYTVGEMMALVVESLETQEGPLLILDEADKLSDQVLYFFITLYNHLEDNCGMVLLSTDHLTKRLQKGLRLNKKGYKEIFSRLSRRVIELPAAGKVDVKKVCEANGITDAITIAAISNDSQGDLRRVKRNIYRHLGKTMDATVEND